MKPNGYVLSDRALEHDLRLALRDDAEACYRLHLHYTLGLGQDKPGFMWERRSAELGSPRGMYSYGVALWSTAKNQAQKSAAKAWIRKAATDGDATAITFLDRY